MELFTWSYLGTLAGCLAGTVILTQLFKNIKPFVSIPTQLFSYFVSVLIFNAAALFTGAWTLSALGLSVLNGAIISLAANGGYDAVLKIIQSTSKTATESNGTTEESTANEDSASTDSVSTEAK